MFKKNLILSLMILAGSAQATVNIENHDLSYTIILDKDGQPDHSKSPYYVEFIHPTDPTGTVNITLPLRGHTAPYTGPTTGYTSIKIKKDNGSIYLTCKHATTSTGPNLTVNVHKNLCNYINHP